MGLEFLARVRHATLWLTVLAALFAAVYVSYTTGVAVAAGAAWSLTNLWLSPARVRRPRVPRAVAGWRRLAISYCSRSGCCS
jgi:hypothetical protein